MMFTKKALCSVLVLMLSIAARVTCKDCLVHDMCSCGYDDGSGSVDLTSLGNTDNTPRFKDVLQSDEGYYYSYNPCGGFSEGTDCSNAAACTLSSDKTQQMQIGNMSPSAVHFKYDDPSGNTVVAYTAGSGVLTLTTVNLVCDTNACDPTFVALGQQGQSQFEMTLTTICACPGMCTASGPTNCSKSGSSSGISAGTILLIMFLCVVVVYLVGGVLFMKFRKQATGTDLIPNKSTWKGMPGLVGTGFKFVIDKCRGRKSAYGEVSS